MFLKPSVLNRLMKQAYKKGLTLAMNEEGWLYIASDWWQVNIHKDFIPKRTLGDIITLTGELPKPGERFVTTKTEGNQMEMELPLEIEESGFEENNLLTVTDLMLIGTQGTIQRLVQDEDTGHIYAVNNVFIDIIDNSQIDVREGEHPVREPLYNPIRGVLWKNNVCKLRVHFRSDDKNAKIMQNIKGIDITPGVLKEC